MILGIVGNDSGIYELVALVHILCAIVGFGSTFVIGLAGARAGQAKGIEALYLSRLNQRASTVLTKPFIYAAGALGAVLVLLSDDSFEFSDTWISLALGLFILGILNAEIFLTRTADRMLALQEEMAAADPPPAGPPPQVAELEALGKKMPMYSGIAHLLLVAIMWTMIVKPGWP